MSTVRGDSYSSSSGTSMATPHVTGVAALLKADDPNRDWRAIKNLILAGGDNIDSMTNTVTQKRLNAYGALTCSNSTVLSRLRPIANTISGSIGEPINLSALHINCADPAGDVVVTVEPGGEAVTLVDDGLELDQAAGDGIYSGQWTPSSDGTFILTFPDGDRITVTVGVVDSITPNPVELASPPPSVTISGAGFADFGFGLPVANFYNSSGTVIAQARASSGDSTTLIVPFPTTQGLFGTLPGLSAGSVTVEVYNQTGASKSWSLVGSTNLTVNDTRPAPEVSSITPSPVDLASPPPSFTITGNGFADFGYGLTVANFTRGGTLLAQARASSGDSTTLIVPFPAKKRTVWEFSGTQCWTGNSGGL